MNEYIPWKTRYKTEEDLMKKTKYPELEFHRNIHIDYFIGKLDRIIKKHNKLKRQVDQDINHKKHIDLDILNSLKNWWVGHILSDDKMYIPHLQEK